MIHPRCVRISVCSSTQNGCTVTPEICGRPTWQVMNCPALDPFTWTCWYAVPNTSVGVTRVDPSAHFHQNPIESATAFAASPDVCSIVRSPLTSNCETTVRVARLYACPAFSPAPSRNAGLKTKFSDRNS